MTTLDGKIWGIFSGRGSTNRFLNRAKRFKIENLTAKSKGNVNWSQKTVQKNFEKFSKKLNSVFEHPNSDNPVSRSLKKNPQLKNLYLAFQRAWNRKYDDYRRRHQAIVDVEVYQESPWYHYKVANYRKLPGPWYRPQRKIDSTAQGLATGFLKRSIGDSFKSGGGKYLKLSVAVDQISWQWLPDSYDNKYSEWLERVTPYMQSIGVVPLGTPFVDFLDSDWQELGEIMNEIYNSGPAEAIIEMINDLIIKKV
jgi:hypothetical protein